MKCWIDGLCFGLLLSSCRCQGNKEISIAPYWSIVHDLIFQITQIMKQPFTWIILNTIKYCFSIRNEVQSGRLSKLHTYSHFSLFFQSAHYACFLVIHSQFPRISITQSNCYCRTIICSLSLCRSFRCCIPTPSLSSPALVSRALVERSWIHLSSYPTITCGVEGVGGSGFNSSHHNHHQCLNPGVVSCAERSLILFHLFQSWSWGGRTIKTLIYNATFSSCCTCQYILFNYQLIEMLTTAKSPNTCVSVNVNKINMNIPEWSLE